MMGNRPMKAAATVIILGRVLLTAIILPQGGGDAGRRVFRKASNISLIL